MYKPQSKYHRTTPVRQFDLKQTLYTTVFEQNKNNMDVDAIGFLGKNITFKELKNNVENVQEFHALDKQFHFLIFKENKMEHIWEEILRISTHYNRMRLLSEMNNHFEAAITQHKDIIRLIESQDIQSVDTVAYKHIIEPKKHWNTFAEENNPYSHYFV